MRKKVAMLGVLAGIVLAGFFVAQMATAQGSPPPTSTTTPGNSGNNPGSPGDDCSHGNSDKACKPDPQPTHGTECDDHGNASGNEDHCLGGTTSTTEQTHDVCVNGTVQTVPLTVTDDGSCKQGGGSGCVTNCSTPGCVSNCSTTTTKKETTTTTTSESSAAVETVETTPAPPKKTAAANGSSTKLVTASAPVELPNTGLKLGLGFGIGAALLLSGLLLLGLTRASRQELL